jgi:adenine-specific DNA methylase
VSSTDVVNDRSNIVSIDGRPRLIEVVFPLRQASLDSVHEKNVRHGHISTLHIWPARRPLAASRATLIATLLPDPGNDEEREALLGRLGGRVVKKVKRKKLPSGKIEETVAEETEGGILHWGRESGPDLEWFRSKIREAYGGCVPRVLDPFAGGGAIPLEAMRLGCEVAATDINPVAWFVLKCTLEYPQRLASQNRPLPKFALESPEFMKSFLKDSGPKGRRRTTRGGPSAQEQMFEAPAANLAVHVLAWGWWVLQLAKADLERFYPVVDGKPTVAYLWARTVQCKNCRATIPLLKTRWLCKKDKKRVLLTMQPSPERTGVIFGVQTNVPVAAGNAAQRREHDKRIGQGTMSRAGAWCPCCGKPGTVAMEMDDIRREGIAGRLGTMMTAVIVEGQGKEYRLPTKEELRSATEAAENMDDLYREIPFGLPTEALPSKEALGFRVPLYGFDRWHKLFTPRQLRALWTFVKHTRELRDVMRSEGYQQEWIEAVSAYLALAVDRLADYSSALCMWHNSKELLAHTFTRFALPIVWDFCEVNPLSGSTGDYSGGLEWIARVVRHGLQATREAPSPSSRQTSAISLQNNSSWDAVITDPPYYDAIPYSDAMDFFYVWLRRCIGDLNQETGVAFAEPLGPKWDSAKADGELVDDASRHGGDTVKSKVTYEDGMYRAFRASLRSLKQDGRMVVVFANKQPDAWETLVSSMIRAGFVATASWPIQTEMNTRMRAHSSAALASSVWLVCKKRPDNAQPGWDNRVLEEMRQKIAARLREFWDAGIRGPDFVWAATGPALEVYSMHPVVKKANESGKLMEVSEFLRHVRRIVVDFVVGRVLSHNGDEEAATGLDDVTTYYLLHRHDFGMDNAPIGACILYAISCGLSDTALVDQCDILIRTGGQATEEDEDEEGTAEDTEAEVEEGTGSQVRLKSWQERRGKNMGYEAPSGRPVPLIDQLHRLMHLWRAGDVVKVDDYLDTRGLRRQALFHQLLQALIELAPQSSEERSLLESISNHLATRGVAVEKGRLELQI